MRLAPSSRVTRVSCTAIGRVVQSMRVQSVGCDGVVTRNLHGREGSDDGTSEAENRVRVCDRNRNRDRARIEKPARDTSRRKEENRATGKPGSDPTSYACLSSRECVLEMVVVADCSVLLKTIVSALVSFPYKAGASCGHCDCDGGAFCEKSMRCEF